MYEKMRLVLIADKLEKGELAEGTAFLNKAGEKVIVKDGALNWLTESGYVASIVGITVNNFREQWTVVPLEDERSISFTEAMALLDTGNGVRFITDGGSIYTAYSLEELDDILTLYTSIGVLYRSEAYDVTGEQLKAVDDSRPATGLYEDNSIAVDGLLEAFGLNTDSKTSGTKLTERDVYAIHFRRRIMGDSVATIADAFSVTNRMVYYILEGTYWREVLIEFNNDNGHINE